MKQTNSWSLLVILITIVTIISCSKGVSKEQKMRNKQMMEAAQKQKDYNKVLQLADSLEAEGCMSQAQACYWRGYAYDRMKEKDKAEAYWRQAMDIVSKSGSNEDIDMYEKSASHLANLLCLNSDFKGTLQMALPAIKLLDEQKRDTTSDYVNLLIYIGLSQVSTGASEDDAESAFLLARKKHQENIARNRNDATYKEAIAGLVNIAYYCVNAGKYQAALYYTSSFGELLSEYQHRPEADAAYMDRQVGRYTIYKAKALKMLGRRREASNTYDAFLATDFSKTGEGKHLAEEYQTLKPKQ